MLAPAGKTVVVGLVIVTTGAVLTLITLIEICLAAVRPPLSTTVAMTTCVPADNTLAINAPVPSGPSILDVQVSRVDKVPSCVSVADPENAMLMPAGKVVLGDDNVVRENVTINVSSLEHPTTLGSSMHSPVAQDALDNSVLS